MDGMGSCCGDAFLKDQGWHTSTTCGAAVWPVMYRPKMFMMKHSVFQK